MKRSQKIGYILYVDEAGDDGIRTVHPIDAKGASEWLVFGATLVRAANGVATAEWVRNFKKTIKGAQRPDIHFHTLSESKRLAACQYLATLPVRCFAVVSNKRNMRGYRNERAEKIGARNPFYNWMLRLLLERATNYCASRTMKDYGEARIMRIELGARGGYSLGQFQAYLSYIRNQSRARALYLSKGDLAWNVIDINEVQTFQAAERDGIQLADIVASAFRQSCELQPDGTCNTLYAEALRPRMAFDECGNIADFGLKIMPHPFSRSGVIKTQTTVFERYGYEKNYLVSPSFGLANNHQPSKAHIPRRALRCASGEAGCY